MDKKYPLQEIDGLHYRMSCAIDLVGAIQECMVHGDNTVDGYADVLYGAFDYLHHLNKEIRDAVDSAYSERRVDNAAN